MLELIAKKKNYIESLIVLCEKKVVEDKENSLYWEGCVSAYKDTLKVLKDIERMYEENLQTAEESLRFLRGEECRSVRDY